MRIMASDIGYGEETPHYYKYRVIYLKLERSHYGVVCLPGFVLILTSHTVFLVTVHCWYRMDCV